MAGINSMAVPAVGGTGKPRGRLRTQRSGIPGEEVAVQAEALRGTLLGVELGGENVIPRDGAGKAIAVVGVAGGVARVRRIGPVAVDEIEPAVVGNVAPDRMRAALAHPGPAHLRQFVAAADALAPVFEAKAPHPAADQPEAGRVLLLAVVEQHLHAHAHPEQRLARGGGEHRVLQPGGDQLAHAVAHRPLAGKHDALGGDHLVGARRDDHAIAFGVGHAQQRLRHRAQVAHAVVDDRDRAAHRHRLPLVDGTTPAERGSIASAIRSARANALNTVSHWWCAFSPSRLSMCSVTRAWFAKPWKNSCASWVSKAPIVAAWKATRMCSPGRPEKSTTTRAEGIGNPLQYSCLENPMDGGAW